MDWVKEINEAIVYMEAHLTEDVGLYDIAEHVNISPFHFQRAFSVIAGFTPAEYMRARRLSQAGAELAHGGCQVIEASLRYGYESPESFTKAFTRFHGVSPAQAKNGSPVRFMNRFAVKIVIEGGCLMEYRIEKLDAFDLVLHIEMFEPGTDETAIPEIWESYYANAAYHSIRASTGVCASLDNDAHRFYGIGCLLTEAEGVPEGFQVIHVPEFTWVVFRCCGPAVESFRKTWLRVYNEWAARI